MIKMKILKPNRITQNESLFSISVIVFPCSFFDEIATANSKNILLTFQYHLPRRIAFRDGLGRLGVEWEKSRKVDDDGTGERLKRGRGQHDADGLSYDRHLSNWPPAAQPKASHHDANDSQLSLLLLFVSWATSNVCAPPHRKPPPKRHSATSFYHWKRVPIHTERIFPFNHVPLLSKKSVFSREPVRIFLFTKKRTLN